MSPQDAIGYYWDFASYESGEAQAYASQAVDTGSYQTFEQIDASMGEAGNWVADYKEQAQLDYEKSLQEPEGLLEEYKAIIAELLENIKAGLLSPIKAGIKWIEERKAKAESSILIALYDVALFIGGAIQTIAEAVIGAIMMLIEAITEALGEVAEFFGDVFEVILQHIVDYAGEKMTGFVANALDIEVE